MRQNEGGHDPAVEYPRSDAYWLLPATMRKFVNKSTVAATISLCYSQGSTMISSSSSEVEARIFQPCRQDFCLADARLAQFSQTFSHQILTPVLEHIADNHI